MQDYIILRTEINKIINEPGVVNFEMGCDINFDPSPYDKNCEKIYIEISSGLNKFSVSGSKLRVEGSSTALRNLSNNLPLLNIDVADKGIVQYHHHYDFCSFPDYVSRDSPLVVLSLRQ